MDKGIDHMPYMSCLTRALCWITCGETDGAGRHTPHLYFFNARTLIRDGHSPPFVKEGNKTANRLYV